MPYNTRRKSLSLPSLGIHLPNASRAHRSPSNPKQQAPSSATSDAHPPPSKKVKRSHSGSASPSPPLPLQDPDPALVKARTMSSVFEHTPPPSPADTSEQATTACRIDTEGISDDIVVAVIQQLEQTGNRPHLIKDLASVLASTNDSIANSANAAALISSRLSIYLKRPWTALAPCPIVKELIPVHPRKVFFYLANSPHQPLPLDSGDIITPTTEPKQLTPSLSAASNDEREDVDEDDLDDDPEQRGRARLSPSPEVDLSNPEFDDEVVSDDLTGHSAAPPGVLHAQPGGFSTRFQAHNHRLSHNHRAASPPLEGDEKEFTQTASSVRERASADDIAGRAKRTQDDVDQTTNSNNAPQTADLNPPAPESDGEYVHSSHAQDREYGYFSSHFTQNHHHGQQEQQQEPQQEQQQQQQQQQQHQQIGTVTERDLFAPSRSPSASSELSAVSSATSATSDGEIDHHPFEASKHTKNFANSMLKGSTDVTVGAGPAISATKLTAMQLSSENSKKSISLLESRLQLDVSAFDNDSTELEGTEKDDVEMTDPMTMIKPVMGLNLLDHALESWSDLQSPETVDIHELDAIFADI